MCLIRKNIVGILVYSMGNRKQGNRRGLILVIAFFILTDFPISLLLFRMICSYSDPSEVPVV